MWEKNSLGLAVMGAGRGKGKDKKRQGTLIFPDLREAPLPAPHPGSEGTELRIRGGGECRIIQMVGGGVSPHGSSCHEKVM